MNPKSITVKKPLAWMHKGEYYAEKVMALGGKDVAGIGQVIRALRIHPAWGGDPIPLQVKLTDDACSPLAEATLPRDNSSFRCTARKITPRQTEFAVLCLVGYAVMGYLRPGQTITLNRHADNREASDARLFAAHLSARLYGGKATMYLPPAHHLTLVDNDTRKEAS